MQKYFLLFLFGGLLAAGVAYADHGEEAELEAVELAESVSLADLGIQDPGTLPTSPFYFFKEWGRGLQSFFTFNSVKKAELEAKFSNEKAAELQAVQKQRPDDEQGIARALSNYQKSQERLATRLEKVQDNSENPNVERLIEEIARKSVLHEKLLQEVQAKHEDKATVREFAREAGLKIADVVRNAASKDNPEDFAERMRSSLAESRGGELKDLRAVEILDRIGESVPEEVRFRLDIVREGFKERAELKVEELAKEDRLEALLQLVPGDQGRRAVVLEELRMKVSDQAANALGRAKDALEGKLSGVEDRKEKAAEQIRRAGDIVEKAKAVAREKGEVRQAVTDLLAQAERHLTAAKQAFENADFGEVFGQASAAEVTARNALRAIEGGEDSSTILERVQTKVQDRVRLLEPEQKLDLDQNTGEPARDVFCTQEYRPVCGVDGKTHSNRCVAERQNRVKVAYEGECNSSTGPTPEEIKRIEAKETLELQNQPRSQEKDSRQQLLEQQLKEQMQQLNQLQQQLREKNAE